MNKITQKDILSSKNDIDSIKDLLMETDMSLSDISKELNCSLNDLNKQINRHGLNWMKKKKRKMSRGHSSLYDILKKLIPNQPIINEYHIGNRLKLDIYCPKYKLALEYHGKQHFYYTGMFHASKEDFVESQKRDEFKSKWCVDNGVSLIVFRYDDGLTEESVFERIIQELRKDNSKNAIARKTRKKLTQSSSYQKAKKENSIKRKKIYKELKRKNSESRRKYK